MDFDFHPPTVYFPLVVPEALMIEPTETEAKETLDAFADAMLEIAREAAEEPRRDPVRAPRPAGPATRRGAGREGARRAPPLRRRLKRASSDGATRIALVFWVDAGYGRLRGVVARLSARNARTLQTNEW